MPAHITGLNRFSPEFGKFFLLEFARELIHNSATEEVVKLEGLLRKKQKEKKREIKERVQKIEFKKRKLPALTKKRISEIEKQIPSKPKKQPPFKPLPKPPILKLKPQLASPLRIPEIRFPPRLQYLRPIPKNMEIDLIKLNPLIKDPKVKSIECNGPDQNIMVIGNMGRKKTSIILTKQEVTEIIQRFAQATKIPASEGIYKVVRGKLILSAIISEVIGSKFIIKKIQMPLFSPPIRGRF